MTLVYKDSSVKERIGDVSLCSEMRYALRLADLIYQRHGFDCVVTSLLDGHHNPGSLHPTGRAADLRCRQVPHDQIQTLFAEIKAHLCPMGFDVVFEGGVGATPATTGAHIHIEYDPKPGREFNHGNETA